MLRKSRNLFTIILIAVYTRIHSLIGRFNTEKALFLGAFKGSGGPG
jgi:hypothetical protein